MDTTMTTHELYYELMDAIRKARDVVGSAHAEAALDLLQDDTWGEHLQEVLDLIAEAADEEADGDAPTWTPVLKMAEALHDRVIYHTVKYRLVGGYGDAGKVFWFTDEEVEAENRFLAESWIRNNPGRTYDDYLNDGDSLEWVPEE